MIHRSSLKRIPLSTRCRRLIVSTLAARSLAPFYLTVFERKFTGGELRRRLALRSADTVDPRPTLRRVAARMAANSGISFSFPSPPKPTDLILQAVLNPDCDWISATATCCKLKVRPGIKCPAPREIVNWSFTNPLFPDNWQLRQALRQQLLDHLLDRGPKQGTASYILFRVHTAIGLTRALPGLRQSETGQGVRLGALLSSLKLPLGLSLHAVLRENGEGWLLEALPSPDWPKVRDNIMADFSQAPSRTRYGLSYNAARLYDWIDSLRPDEMLDDWSPPVEPVSFTEIGFDPDPATGRVEPLSELIEEINTNTQYSLSLQRWSQEKPVVTRIRVARTPLSLYEGVSEIKRHVGELRPGERAVLTITIQPREKHRIVRLSPPRRG